MAIDVIFILQHNVMKLPQWIIALCFLGISSQLYPNSWGKNNFGSLKDSASAVFNGEPVKVYGIGFSSQNGASFNQYINSNQRLNDALNKVEELGYNLIRTWGYNSYSVKIYDNIVANNRTIKVQQGIWLETSDLNTCISIVDNALQALEPYKHLVLGISLLNETEGAVTAQTLGALITYARYNYPDYLYTANFLSGTLNKEEFSDVFTNLDYINVNEYGGYFGFGGNHSVENQINQISEKNYSAVSDDKLVVIGETGWQSYPRSTNEVFDNKLTAANLCDYYYKISNMIYNGETRYGFMFYFNLSSAGWKNKSSTGGYNDDDWGLFLEGGGSSLGAPIWNAETVSSELRGKLNNGNVVALTTHYPSIPTLTKAGHFFNLSWVYNDYVYLQSSTDLETWTTIGNSSPHVDPVSSKKFYRTKVMFDR